MELGKTGAENSTAAWTTVLFQSLDSVSRECKVLERALFVDRKLRRNVGDGQSAFTRSASRRYLEDRVIRDVINDVI